MEAIKIESTNEAYVLESVCASRVAEAENVLHADLYTGGALLLAFILGYILG